MRGISTRKTSIGWTVVRLHYSADKAKDPATPEGRAWLAHAKMGMSDARWRKEFEIDYGALGGQLVFPGFDESVHLVDAFAMDPVDWTVWLACDPHPRTPHAFLWLAVNREREMVVGWTHWPQRKSDSGGPLTVKDYVEDLKLVDASTLGLKPYKRVMDVAGRGMNASEEKSYFVAYRDAGVIFHPAKRNRDLSGFDAINEALKPTDFVVGDKAERRPRLTIMRGAGDNDELVYELKTLRFAEWKGNVTDKDAPERPEEKRRHLVDCLCYVLLEKPYFVDRTPNHEDFEPIYENVGY